MSLKIEYKIDKVWFRDFGAMVSEMLDKLSGCENIPLRLIFFGNPDNNDQYIEHLDNIRWQVAQRYGHERMPLLSYVAQRSLDSGLVLESQWVAPQWEEHLRRKELDGARYFTINSHDGKYIFTEGVLAGALNISMLEQSDRVLEKIGNILSLEKMPINSIVRQWNYIERITETSFGNQHYQDFNDSRSHFYAQTTWDGGYPAATGIGTDHGGIMVEVDALLPANAACYAMALDNALQVAAHVYSQEVLIGVADKKFQQKTTPKFERAKALVTSGNVQVYISGTAAIRGEDSLHDVGIEQQTVTTLENIEYLISKENLKKYGVTGKSEPKIKIFRVYLKSENLLEAAREIILKSYPDVCALYVHTDVCRDELLIEIEGVAQ